jgi:hypothetical protein
VAPPKLAILAGAGPLPGEIAAACRDAGRDVFIIAHEGITDPATLADTAHEWINLGAIQRTMTLLHDIAAVEVMFAGPVQRPSLTSLRLDGRAMKAIAKWGRKALGDDKLLSLLVGEIESEGFRVVGIDSILGDMVAPSGVMGDHAPDDAAEADIAIGCRVARTLGALDVGQAVVVQQGMVLGVEAIEGTDSLLRRCVDLRRAGPGGVLVKVKKPLQEARADLPTIGPDTVASAHAAGLRGIALEAGGALVVDRARTVEAADAAGLFIIGIAPGEM